jgi:hypothetical protein
MKKLLLLCFPPMLALCLSLQAAEIKPEALVEMYGPAVVVVRAQLDNGQVSQGTGFFVGCDSRVGQTQAAMAVA